MPLHTWRQKDFDNHFNELGIKKGDKICVHSKLLSFGYIENGISTVLNSLKKIVGETGLLVFPSYTFKTNETNIFSVLKTKPQGMGSFSNYIWSLKNIHRSPCPIHSHIAIGKNANLLSKINGLSSIGPNSDFEFFHKNNFNLLMLGLGFTEGASYMHYVEYCAKVPYRKSLSLKRNIEYPDGTIKSINVYYYGRPKKEYKENGIYRPYLENYDTVEQMLLKKSKIIQIKTPYGRSSYCSIVNAHNCAMEMVQINPYAMVKKNIRHI